MSDAELAVTWAEAVFRRACECFDTRADSAYQRHKNMERVELARMALRKAVILAECGGG